MKRRILFIGSMGEEYGGVTQFAYDLCNSPLKDLYDFGFLNYYDVEERSHNIMVELKAETYQVSRYSVKPLSFMKEIRKFYHDHDNYDIIYCNASHASVIMYTMPLWFSRKAKLVFHSHASDGNCKYLHKLFRIMVNWRCDLRIACSEHAAEWMYGKNKDVRVIYNGIDTAKFKYNLDTRKKIRAYYQIEDAYVVGYFSRFTEGKNHLFLLDIFREIVRIKKNAILLLIGDGKCKNTIIEKLDEYHLSDKSIVLPSQEKIQDYYNVLDLFIFPSKSEGFPLIGIEAQASGLPILMSDNITRSVACTSLAVYRSLKETAKEWAECAYNMGINEDREKAWLLVKQAGFDKKEIAEKIISLLKTIGG